MGANYLEGGYPRRHVQYMAIFIDAESGKACNSQCRSSTEGIDPLAQAMRRKIRTGTLDDKSNPNLKRRS